MSALIVLSLFVPCNELIYCPAHNYIIMQVINLTLFKPYYSPFSFRNRNFSRRPEGYFLIVEINFYFGSYLTFFYSETFLTDLEDAQA